MRSSRCDHGYQGVESISLECPVPSRAGIVLARKDANAQPFRTISQTGTHTRGRHVDSALARHYTRRVRRGFTVLAAVILVSMPGTVISLHLHAYGDHDHSEHRHGLAAHRHTDSHRPAHRHPAEGSAQLAAEIGPCAPGAHVVSIACCAEVAPTLEMPHAVPMIVATLPNPRSSFHRLGVVDVREHGPPRTGPAAPRAPPA